MRASASSYKCQSSDATSRAVAELKGRSSRRAPPPSSFACLLRDAVTNDRAVSGLGVGDIKAWLVQVTDIPPGQLDTDWGSPDAAREAFPGKQGGDESRQAWRLQPQAQAFCEETHFVIVLEKEERKP
ncbi:hypothetical protein TREES_T100010853 [Tupaia chinensis]|uniref:Uncharacterized protein n=1 Tax=Tupaia chinensis TaxID=246437 RepID=L9KJ55_TUPCH|nr:hypothetical protein TREES_T100010853 [Tupaia chinensis]